MIMTRARAGSLERFVIAQNPHYRQIVREISQGRKKTHWMWYVFPQLKALAKSETARYYGITDRAEAVAYLDHPVLRARLYECATGVLHQRKLMFTDVDRRKLRSCMTLFAEVTGDRTLPDRVLAKFFEGLPDQLTLDVLAGKPIELPRSRPAIPGPRRYEQGMLRMPVDTEPWTRERINSFVRSFGLSTVATRQLVDAWMADRGKAMGAVWAAREETDWRDR